MNHAAFWNGEQLSLTPAYDICPQNRTRGETTQAMIIADNNRFSQLSVCVESSHHFLLSKEQAHAIIEDQKFIIENAWSSDCDEANLSQVDRKFLWGRQFLYAYAFEGLIT